MGFFNLYHQKPLIGVKGRIQSRVVETDNEKKYYTDVVAERITFLSNRKQEESDK